MEASADPRFGRIIEPNTFDELIAHAAGSLSERKDVRMWRGQSDESWLLDSAAYRRVRIDKIAPTERDIAYYERQLLDQATHRGYRYVDNRELSDFELLARLQHHGAATRLIDTTRSVLVALYFACSGSREKNGLLFGISSRGLGGGEGRTLNEKYTDRMQALVGYPHPQTWEPPGISRRVAAQHSQFVYSCISPTRQAHGSLALDHPKDYLITLRILASHKQLYLQFLERHFDITLLSLFPDLDGFGRAHEHSREQWANERW